MSNITFERALKSISHPISIGAIIVLLLNDHWWRLVAPSWFTGKIGDFAWLIFAPFLLAALLAWLPKRLLRDANVVGYTSIVGTGLIFALAKTLPSAHAVVVRTFEITMGWAPTIRIDPTDLIALPALWIAWFIWRHTDNSSFASSPRGWMILSIGVLASAANTPAIPDYGINCLFQQDSKLIATSYPYSGYYSNSQTYSSEDGGLTWGGEPAPNDITARCANHSGPGKLTDPANEQVQYRLSPGIAIDRSTDGGQTWQTEISFVGAQAHDVYYMRLRGENSAMAFNPTPADAYIDAASSNLIVAMGHAGVLLRTPDAQWHWISLGSNSYTDLSDVSNWSELLRLEMGNAFILYFLVVILTGVNIPGTLTSKWSTFALSIGGVLWLVSVLISQASVPTNSMPPAPDLESPVKGLAMLGSAAIAILRSYFVTDDVHQRYPHNWHRVIIIPLTSGLFFFLPYYLWSQGVIPQYSTALLCSLALVVVISSAGIWYLRKYFSAVSQRRDTKSQIESEN